MSGLPGLFNANIPGDRRNCETIISGKKPGWDTLKTRKSGAGFGILGKIRTFAGSKTKTS
jgi:hypothetical protein